MKVYKIVPTTKCKAPVYFGGDSAYVEKWPKNPDDQDLLLIFTIDCKAASEQLNRTELPKSGLLHVFSTYEKDEYFLDCLTCDEVQEGRGTTAYTRVIFTDHDSAIESPRPPMPLRFAELVESNIDDSEFCVSSLVSNTAPNGVLIPEALAKEFNFFCQIYSSDFPEPFQDALYLTDALGCILINKCIGGEIVDGCFYVQVA